MDSITQKFCTSENILKKMSHFSQALQKRSILEVTDWLVQWVVQTTLDLRVVSSSPTLGIELALKKWGDRKMVTYEDARLTSSC